MSFTPTPEQLAIVDMIETEPNTSLLVDARAGAAKTSTIVLAADKIKVRPALAVAFNKRNAEDLKLRLPQDFETKTLNGAGHQAWMRVVGKLQVDDGKILTITKQVCGKRPYDDETIPEVMALVRGARVAGLIPFGAPMGKHGLVIDHPDAWEEIAFAKGFTLTDETLGFARQVLKTSISQAYQRLIDFDDQIYMSVLFGGIYNQYHTVIVDESQDLSPLNHLQLCKLVSRRLIAVGDPYQAIYAFRGADNNSMANLQGTIQAHHPSFVFKRLGLTYTFRAPQVVVARQLDHVPDYKAHEVCAEGEVINWPPPKPSVLDVDLTQPITETEPVRKTSWSLFEVPAEGFILCRNNAPLIKLAFTFIRHRRPVKILGRDIGAQLGSILNKITNKRTIPIAQTEDLLDKWFDRELAKAGDSEMKASVIRDRYECLNVLIESSGAETSTEAVQFIKDLFSDQQAQGLVLSSGHRAKGLETEWVMHLDPWRVPSRFALEAQQRGNEDMIRQELNLKYVIETRTKSTLVLANLEDCEEVGR